MNNRKYLPGQSGYSESLAFAVTAIAICVVLMGALVQGPAAATPDVSTHSTAT